MGKLTPAPSNGGDLAVERLCGVLARRERIVAVEALEESGRMDVDELAAILAREEEMRTDRALAQLMHTHLPKMEDVDAVQHNRDTVEPASEFDRVARALELLRSL